MAKAFNESNGSAKKGASYYKWVDGDQSLRLVGEIVPRYVYWKKFDDKNLSFECLSFDRDEERFLNAEKDWFKEFFPTNEKGEETKCSWAYVARAIDPDDKTKTILVPLKKKLWQQVIELASELGDPTDIETGYDLVISRKKTGSHAFNVEYTLKQLKCKPRPLDEVERETVANMPPIDELVPRPTPEEQKAQLEKLMNGDNNTAVDEDAAAEVASGVSDDLPE